MVPSAAQAAVIFWARVGMFSGLFTVASLIVSRLRKKSAGKGESVMVPIAWYLVLAAILFSVGVASFLIKRNIITIFMSIELMLNAVNLTFVAFAHMWHQVQGQIFVFFVMVVAAAEAAVGLAIIIAIFRTRQTLNVDQINLMKDPSTS